MRWRLRKICYGLTFRQSLSTIVQHPVQQINKDPIHLRRAEIKRGVELQRARLGEKNRVSIHIILPRHVSRPMSELFLIIADALLDGWATEDHVHFPAQVVYDSAKPEPTTLAESASFGNYVLKAHMTKSVQIVTPDDTALLAARTPTTTLGDKMNAIVVIPIKTSENSKIRAVAIVGLNPRKALDEDYSTFLEVFAQSLSNGIAGVLLYSEELRRSHALAALNRQKNDELQILLAARTEELKSSETRFETMSSISPAGIFMAANGQVVYANEAWFSISGVPRDVDPSSFMEYVHPDDLEMAKEVWASAHASTAAPCEFRWRVPSGQPERWSVAISKPALDDAGNIMWVGLPLLRCQLHPADAKRRYRSQAACESANSSLSSTNDSCLCSCLVKTRH